MLKLSKFVFQSVTVKNWRALLSTHAFTLHPEDHPTLFLCRRDLSTHLMTYSATRGILTHHPVYVTDSRRAQAHKDSRQPPRSRLGCTWSCSPSKGTSRGLDYRMSCPLAMLLGLSHRKLLSKYSV